jgi:type I restriction enzyme S subunit
LIRLKLRPEVVDPAFLVVFMNGSHGALQRKRFANGVNLFNVNMEELDYFDIPCPQPAVQTYIGNKVRQAERLRTWARTLEAEAEGLLAAALGAGPSDWLGSLRVSGILPSGGFRTRVPANLIRGRLNPDGYHPELREISVQASEQPLFRRLPELAAIVTEQRERLKAGKSLTAYISILHVDGNGFIDINAATSHVPESDGRECFAGDVLVSGINPSANRIGVCAQCQGRVACSPEFSILRPTGEVEANYLAFALRSVPCLHQLIHLGQGTSSSRRRVEEIELEDLWVPVIAEHQKVTQQLASRQICVGFASALTGAAKLLVEGLIDGHISEADLQEAHANRIKDEEILRRLTAKGLDVADEPPLFPDLAKLEEALANAGGPAT